MAAEIFTALSALRMVLDSETDADSPDNETTFAAIRVAIESLFMILLGTGFNGTVATVAAHIITHADAAQGTDTHVGRTTVMTSGAAKGNFYTIDDSSNYVLTHTGDDLEADGVEIGDTFVVLYDIKTNTGHTHDDINAANIDLADNSVDSEHYAANSIDTEHYAPASVNTTAVKTGTGTTSGDCTGGSEVEITMQDYCFFPHTYGVIADMRMNPSNTSAANYIGMFCFYVDGVTTRAYNAYWRYITSSDEPFVYSIRDKATGEIVAVWACEDPPPGYWGLDKPPADFVPPVRFTPALTNVEEIVLFKYPKAGYRELVDRSKTDKVHLHDMLTADFDYNDKAKLFTAKNLVHI